MLEEHRWNVQIYLQLLLILESAMNIDLKQEIHVIIQSKHSCLLD